MLSSGSRRRSRSCAACDGPAARGQNRAMNPQKVVVPILAIVLLAIGWRMAGWPGVALAVGALVMYLLLHFNRLMAVMRKAADRPKGYVGSAVMLNAKLKPG